MNPIELRKPDGTPAGIYLCGKCGKIYPERMADEAERCCRPYVCVECGREVKDLFGLTYDLAAAIAEDPALRRLEASDDEYDDKRDEEYENSPRGLAGFGRDEWI